MKVIVVQAENYKFYYGRYAKEIVGDKKSLMLDEDKKPDSYLHIEIPVFIVQPYHDKGPKDDRSVHSVWDNGKSELDKVNLEILKSQAYGSKHLVTALLVSMGFKEVETREKKKTIEVYQPGQEQIAYEETDVINNVLKGNLL